MKKRNITKVKNIIIYSERAKRTREKFSCVFQVIKNLNKKINITFYSKQVRKFVCLKPIA